MLQVALDHKSSVVATIEIANLRSAVDISDNDWANAAMIKRMLEPFHAAVKAMEGNHLALAQAPCIMVILDAHIEKEAAAFDAGPFAAAGDRMLLDHADRWDELPNVMKMAAALNPRTKGLEWIDAAERDGWRALLSNDLKLLFAEDIRDERAKSLGGGGRECGDGGSGSGGASGSGGSSGSGGGSGDANPPAKKYKKRSFVSRAVALAKARRPGDQTDGDRSATSRPPSRLPILARLQAAEDELRRFVHETGLVDDYDEDEVDTKVRRREDELTWWCRRQIAYPCLARLAIKYLVIPPSSAASERIFSMAGGIVTKRRNHPGDDALVFLNGSHGVAWESRISQDVLGRVER